MDGLKREIQDVKDDTIISGDGQPLIYKYKDWSLTGLYFNRDRHITRSFIHGVRLGSWWDGWWNGLGAGMSAIILVNLITRR